MELADLKVFVIVAEEGSATVAARVLGKTQPGISQHLKRLENEVGARLFDRKGQRLIINEFGKSLLEKAKKLMDDVDDLKSLSSAAIYPQGTLKLGLTDAASLVLTPSALFKFRQRYPKIHIELDVDASNYIEEKIVNGNYDIGVVTTGLQPHPQLKEYILYEDYVDLLCPPDHPLSKRSSVSLRELANHTLIMSPKRRRTRQIIDETFRVCGITPKDVIDVYSQTAAIQLAEAGLGVALLPRKIITSWGSKGLCKRLKISDTPIKRTLSLIHRKNSEMSEAAAFFHKVLMENMKEFRKGKQSLYLSEKLC